MTQSEFIKKYLEWASGNAVYAHPRDIEEAVSLSEFDAESHEGNLTGTQILAITKHRRDRLYIFIFSHKTTWLCDDIGDTLIDNVEDEQYEIIAMI